MFSLVTDSLMVPPTQIFLTPTNNAFSYRISWVPSVCDNFNYTITTSLSTSFSESGHIIMVQNSDESIIKTINVSISSFSSVMYSTFRIGRL